MERIHHTNITFSIVTQGSEPLELPEHIKERLLVAFEVAVGSHVDLRYNPDGNRYQEAYHRFLGAEIVEDSK